MTDAAVLLARAEQQLFTGPPADAAPLLEQVRVLAAGRPEADRATWLLGLSLAHVGRFGGALALLTPLAAPDADPTRRALASLAGSAVAAAHRQLGRHAAARAADDVALGLAGASAEAAADALLGLAGDAVGLGEPQEAARRLAEAGEVVDEAPPAWWRQRVRLDRVRAEAALLDGRPDDAAACATAAVERARAAGGQRHTAKALLVLGLTQVSAGSAAAAGTLRGAAELATTLGALPLVWPSSALLGALLADGDPLAARVHLDAAAGAVAVIAADLPPGVRAAWLARPEVAALR